MNPASFPEQNMVFAENQPEYLPLPAHRMPDGTVFTRWRLTWRERLKLLVKGDLWIMLLTFNLPLQPILPSVDKPFRPAGEEPHP